MTLQDLVEEGRHLSFEHIASPINGDPNRVKKITLIRREDTELAARLPCPVWNVGVAEIDPELVTEAWSRQHHHAPVKDSEIRQSCLSEDAAKQAARQILQDLCRANQECVSRVITESPFAAGIFETQSRKPRWAIQVRYDEGSVLL